MPYADPRVLGAGRPPRGSVAQTSALVVLMLKTGFRAGRIQRVEAWLVKTKTIAPFIEEFGPTLAAQVGRIRGCVS
ncbi:hypothetical protein [Mesorhizobium sp. M1136]|uniref:hypothetical protein n=1 Tax=Mesorhizobium sp. M1136 TaxID=2957059 RepID=UPI00333A35A7